MSPNDNEKHATGAPPSAEPQFGLIASLLLREEVVTLEKLTYAKRIQSKLPSARKLIDILQELGYVTAEQIRAILRKHQLNIRIGELLVELGYLRDSDLQSALEMQKTDETRKRIGEILVEGGFIEERRLKEALALQLGFSFVELAFSSIDRSLLKVVPLAICRKFSIIPVRRSGEATMVAFDDPLDAKSRDAASNYFGKDYTVALAMRSDLEELLSTLEKAGEKAAAVVIDDNTVTGIINGLLEDAIRDDASDIHIEPMRERIRVRFRRDGVMMHHRDFPRDIAPQLATRIKVMSSTDIAERRRHQDGRILYESTGRGITIDLRVSIFITIYGEKIVLRLLNRKGGMLSLKEIGMAPRMLERFIYEALDTPTGVMIITGPTGSGKTSTLYGCVNYLNSMSTSIITAEEPVEYVIDGVSQCSINPRIGLTFEETLRHIVRQDPDIIVMGEIRDQFSAETAIQAALTGHKVLTTFHTEDSIGGLIRLLNMEIEAFLISSTVVCVLAQRLLRKICPNCSEPYLPTPLELARLGYGPQDIAGSSFSKGHGCPKCRFTGFRGRTGVFELLVLNELVKDSILANKTSYEIRRLSTESAGLVSLLEDAVLKAAKGIVSLEQVLKDLPRLGKPRPLVELRRILGGAS
ncbi:MAG: Flp pilus assembly complex ATPase component TadA [Geobacter sp.]|nr:Flp pilus assembly complex ATPase component TadA [Geobacter sp.]